MTKPSIYRDLLLEHARHPNNCGRLESPDLRATAFNPLCGDELELTLAVSEDIIQDCKTKVRGCSICQASASMMSDLILTKTLQEAEKISKVFTESLSKENEVISESLDSLRPLIALKKHRSRIKCMKLAWDALEDCARQNQT
ncbi:MAG: SUF system NifU family Fe-S cluster assembly protein [SAR324 cluster bacterium]|nr:SUF system NifU family Fe-S cluster assembly protein [SAR324 cluster bacterium]